MGAAAAETSLRGKFVIAFFLEIRGKHVWFAIIFFCFHRHHFNVAEGVFLFSFCQGEQAPEMLMMRRQR